jgi:hypothetical protein
MFGRYNMANSIFYIFADPMGDTACKIGLSTKPDVRLGTYQNSYSSRSHMAQFDCAWYGSSSVVAKLENTVKTEFEWDIERDGRGHSEWVYDLSVEDIENKVQDIIEGFHYKVKPVPTEFLPMTVEKYAQFKEYLKNA